MFEFLKSNKGSAKAWFVGISLAALLILGLLLLMFNYTFNTVATPTESELEIYSNNLSDISEDPFITMPAPSDYNQTKPIITNSDPVWGNPQAELSIIYFADYDCKHCTQQLDLIKSVISQDYPERVNLIWKDYPEVSAQSFSFKAAVAGRCAQAQDSFWEFEENFMKQFPVFKVQQGQNTEAFNQFILGLVEELNLNRKSFITCLGQEETIKPIQNDFYQAQALGLPGVPFTFIGEREVLGEYQAEQLVEMINQQLPGN